MVEIHSTTKQTSNLQKLPKTIQCFDLGIEFCPEQGTGKTAQPHAWVSNTQNESLNQDPPSSGPRAPVMR